MKDKRAEKGIKIIVACGILFLVGLFILGRTLDHYGIGEPTAVKKTRLVNTPKGDANDLE